MMEAQKSQPKAFFRCCLPQCSGLRFNLLHKFPRKIERAEEWLEAFDCPRLNGIPHKRLTHFSVCCRHFRVQDYVHPTARTLNYVAVPSLNLKKLNQLDICRQTEMEKPSMLLVEEIEWLKNTASNQKVVDKDQIYEEFDLEPEISASPILTTETSIDDATMVDFISPEITKEKNSLPNLQPDMIKETNAIILENIYKAPLTSKVATKSKVMPTNTTISEDIRNSKVMGNPKNPQNSSMEASNKNYFPKTNPESENIVTSSLNIADDLESETCIEDYCDDIQITVNDRILEIIDKQWDKPISFDVLWLRSICHCSECYDKGERITKINIFDLPTELQPVMATILEKPRRLEIVWSGGGHSSTYDINEIYEKSQSSIKSIYCKSYLLWTSQHIKYRDDLKPLKFYDIITSDTAIYTALDRLQKSGVLIIQDIPKCDKDSVLKKSIISKLFNHVWDNMIYEKRMRFPLQHQKTPFTNCTFESMDKGLQILTVPYYKENFKLKLCLVDGFQAATQLRKISYDYLTQHTMDFGFTNDHGYQNIIKRPIIEKEENKERITYSPYHMENIKSQDFKEISMHVKNFNDILRLTHNQWNVELSTNTMIILDNYRICWCINSPDINCELDCFYMERKHYLSSLNILMTS